MDPSRTPSRPGFRDDIQGLRAVAVLTVLAAHAGLTALPGGFVGVDVFFVISGFLITQLLVVEAGRRGRISLTAFYARRARRILPAASVVLVVTVGASLLWLSVLESISLAKDALWAAVFAANVRFAQQGVDYFAAEEAPSPVQHYWSLAVEEQFYLVWPLLVVACVAWAARRRTTAGRSATRPLVAVLVVVGTASLAWSLVQTAAEPQSAYFSTFTRAWEFAVGAGVALAVHAGRTLGSRRLAEPLVWGGLVAVAVACVTYSETMPFPGSAALLPVLGTAAVLWAGADAGVTTTAGRLLSAAPMRAIGDWSYSLYLWHWPLLVVPVNALGRDLTTVEVLLLVALAFELAYLTHRFVETPFRTGARITAVRPRRSLVLYPVFLALVGSTAGAGWAWSDYRVGERGDDPAITAEQFGITADGPEALVRASVMAARQGLPTPSDLSPDLVDLEDDLSDVGSCRYDDDSTWELCPRGDVDGDKTLVVIGDSHARAWIPAFDALAERAGYRAYYLAKAQCSAALLEPSEAFTGEPWPPCPAFHDWTREQLTALSPDLVVMTSSAPITGVIDGSGVRQRGTEEVAAELRTGLRDMFAAYSDLTERFVMLVDVPRLSLDPGTCLSTFGSDLATCTAPPDATGQQLRALTVEEADRAGVEVLDPSAWFCADDLCPLVVGSTIAYRDRGHITSTRAAELTEPLARGLGLW